MKNKYEEYGYIESYEKCSYCKWENKDDETLPEEGAPISGIYPICPKCGKDWEFERVITKRIPMVRMTKEYFDTVKK